MDYTCFLIRQQRLAHCWSQEGLCKDICAVSYLSKIEQGKAEPSPEILRLLFKKLGICWHDEQDGCDSQTVQDALEYLLCDEMDSFFLLLESPQWKKLENSRWALDCQLLNRYSDMEDEPLDTALEVCMDQRQLALQRRLQGRWEEALRLWPCGWMYLGAGEDYYQQGNAAQAIEFLQIANDLAAQEGRPRLMLRARSFIGNCYCNLHDFPSMERHYTAARRLAQALEEPDYLRGIAYNIATSHLERGQCEPFLAYFETLEQPDGIDLHKLALCYEKLGRKDEALAALDAADELSSSLPENVLSKMCELVRLRLTDPDYLDSSTYGEALLNCFALCKQYLPVGFCLFHLPWMLEWHEHHRQYKQAYSLLLDFPEYRQIQDLNNNFIS